MYSPMPNGEQLDAGGESEGSNADSDYAEDRRGAKMTWRRVKKRFSLLHATSLDSKHRQDPASTPSKTLASSTRNVKHDRAATTESVEKVAKQPKLDAPIPRKAVPRMRIVVPVASA